MIGVSLNSPVTWCVITVTLIVVALTISTRRANLRPRESFASSSAEWSAAQARFVESPRAGCEQAQRIVERMLRLRGLDAGLPELLDARYRAACSRAARGDASTDDLRAAFIEFRAAFEALRESHPKRADA